MSPDIIIGLLAGLLFAALVFSGALWVTRLENTRAWRERAHRAEDAKHAAELRSAEQIDAMLDRISASSRIELSGGAVAQADPSARLYIPDTPDADAEWNDYRGEPAEDEDNS